MKQHCSYPACPHVPRHNLAPFSTTCSLPSGCCMSFSPRHPLREALYIHTGRMGLVGPQNPTLAPGLPPSSHPKSNQLPALKLNGYRASSFRDGSLRDAPGAAGGLWLRVDAAVSRGAQPARPRIQPSPALGTSATAETAHGSPCGCSSSQSGSHLGCNAGKDSEAESGLRRGCAWSGNQMTDY